MTLVLKCDNMKILRLKEEMTMVDNMILAAADAADIYTLGNDIFTEILTVLFIGALVVCAVILGAKLRKVHDSKEAAAAEIQISEADADSTGDKN